MSKELQEKVDELQRLLDEAGLRIDNLLNCPDLNWDDLDPYSIEAIEDAQIFMKSIQ